MRRTLSTPARIAALAAAPALLLGGAAVTQAQAATPRVTETGLTATTTASGTSAEVSVKSSSCVTVRSLGVAVRDVHGDNVDFPHWRGKARICPGGLTFAAGSRRFPAGRYTMFGAYLDTHGTWHNLASKTLTVGGSSAAPKPAPAPTGSPASAPTPVPAPTSSAPTPAPAPPSQAPAPASTPTRTSAPAPAPTSSAPTPAPSASTVATGSIPSGVASSNTPVWDEEFNGPINWGQRWVGNTTTSYQYGDHNPNDNKLDWLDQNDVSVANGVATFTAQPSSHTLENGQQAWTTGLLTTEGSQEGFQVKTGDYVETRVQLPTQQGAWPALWTWKNGNGEIDSFEYHPDNPNLLELSNHVNAAHDYYTDANAIKPGGWVTIGTKYGANSVDWYVNGVKVYSDNTGVGANWSAYLILNLSLSAGQYHPAPTGSGPITFAVDYLRVYH
jgi:hypothetical protein